MEEIKLFSEQFNNNTYQSNQIYLIKKNGGNFMRGEYDGEIYRILKKEKFKEILHDELRECTKQYQEILNIVNLTEDFFNPILAFVLMTSILYIIFELYALISVSKNFENLDYCEIKLF